MLGAIELGAVFSSSVSLKSSYGGEFRNNTTYVIN